MRELIPVTRCDRCSGDIPADTRSTQVVITWPDGSTTAYAGESCSEHLAELELGVKELASMYLVPDDSVSKAKPKTARGPAKPLSERLVRRPDSPEAIRTCPICGNGDREFPNPYVAPTRSALGQHLNSQHKTTFGKLGLTLPGGRRD